jgi:hypothetical protein
LLTAQRAERVSDGCARRLPEVAAANNRPGGGIALGLIHDQVADDAGGAGR